jgi:hypothetical protein
MAVQIKPLAEVADAIPLSAEWIGTEWHNYDGRSQIEIENSLRENLNRGSIPITFVALEPR